MHRHSRAIATLFAWSALVGVANADPAPIVYAGQGQSGSAAVTQTASYGAASLAGGADNSYGYGAQQRSGAATIDLRRPAARVAQAAPQQPLIITRTTSVDAPPPRAPEAAPAPAARPQWLEQERVGPPYEANGRTYVPTPEPGYSETGMASWYGPQFHGRRAANGEVFDQEALTAAHPTLPLNSLVQVTNLENGREVMVRVTDRGPFVGGRLIDMSRGAAQALGFEAQGHARVHVRYLGPAPRRAVGAAAPEAAPSEEGPSSLLPPAPPPAPASAAAAPAPVGSGDAYYVQVGAFSDMSNVQRVRAEAGAAGPVVVDTRLTASGAELFRVRVGPWTSRAEADAARQTLASLGYGESVVASR